MSPPSWNFDLIVPTVAEPPITHQNAKIHFRKMSYNVHLRKNIQNLNSLCSDNPTVRNSCVEAFLPKFAFFFYSLFYSCTVIYLLTYLLWCKVWLNILFQWFMSYCVHKVSFGHHWLTLIAESMTFSLSSASSGLAND